MSVCLGEQYSWLRFWKNFCYKDNKVMQYNSGEQNNRILSLHRKRTIKNFFSALFSNRINLLIRGSIEVNIR